MLLGPNVLECFSVLLLHCYSLFYDTGETAHLGVVSHRTPALMCCAGGVIIISDLLKPGVVPFPSLV